MGHLPREPRLWETPEIIVAALELSPARAHSGRWYAPTLDPYHLRPVDDPLWEHGRFVGEYLCLWEPDGPTVLLELLEELRADVDWRDVYAKGVRAPAARSPSSRADQDHDVSVAAVHPRVGVNPGSSLGEAGRLLTAGKARRRSCCRAKGQPRTVLTCSARRWGQARPSQARGARCLQPCQRSAG